MGDIKNCTDSQLVALQQLKEYESGAKEAFIIHDVKSPPCEGGFLCVRVSISNEGFVHRKGGVKLEENEYFTISIPTNFPYSKPYICVENKSFQTLPHVQWSGDICLYYSTDREWEPQRGMYGFLDRLIQWLKKASRNELKDINFPLHPPVAWAREKDSCRILVEENTPEFEGSHWYGYAKLCQKDHKILSLSKWILKPVRDKGYILAPTILLKFTTHFQQYPKTFRCLTEILQTDAQVSVKEMVKGTICSMVHGGTPLKDIYFVLGTLSRSGQNHDDLKQHLVSWKFPASIAREIVKAHRKASIGKKDVLNKAAEAVLEKLCSMSNENLDWVEVIENRPEVTKSRDSNSPVKFFEDKKILLLGCGAIGSKIAYHLVRSKAAQLCVVDNGIVTPGLICRQNYKTLQIGQNKALALKENLEEFSSREIKALSDNVVDIILRDISFINTFDLIIDATASNAVLSVLDKVRNEGHNFTVVSFAISANADCSMATLINKNSCTNLSDILRRDHLKLLESTEFFHFTETFWPRDPRKLEIEPEPGCSDPTFSASDSEVADHAAIMMNMVSEHLSREPDVSAFSYFHMRYDPNKDVEIYDLFFRYDDDDAFDCKRSGFKILLSDSARKSIEKEISLSSSEHGEDKESGGHLLGEVDTIQRVVFINECISPKGGVNIPSASEFVFDENNEGELTKEIKKKYKRKIKWLGHWHTHPNGSPTPSTTDENAMKKILETQKGPFAMVIIGGTKEKYDYAAYVYE